MHYHPANEGGSLLLFFQNVLLICRLAHMMTLHIIELLSNLNFLHYFMIKVVLKCLHFKKLMQNLGKFR